MTFPEYQRITNDLHNNLRYKKICEYYHANKTDISNLIQDDLKPMLGETLKGENKINYRGETSYLVSSKFLKQNENFEVLKQDEMNKSYTFFHLGGKLTGHENIIHGGILATLLDELTCRLAFQNFHSKNAVTANLSINYRKPCFANTYVVVKCQVLSKKDRKCVVKGYVYKFDLDSAVDDCFENEGHLLTECECLVIKPKWSDSM